MTNFQIVGSKVYDPSGNEFVVKGINCNGYRWCWPNKVVNDVKLLADVWKFNTIRFNCLLGNNGGDPRLNDNNNIDEIIEVFTSRKIVTMWEAHDKTGGFYTDSSTPSLQDLKNFFVPLAQKYKDNPYVWINVQNEPGAIPVSDQWIKTHGEIIKAIRKVGNNNIIVCDGGAWGQDTCTWDSNAVDPNNSCILKYGQSLMNYEGVKQSNVTFSVHLYEQWNGGDYRMKNFIEQVHNKGLSLHFGEYGIENNHHDCSKAMYSMQKVAFPMNVGGIAWAWYNGDGNCLFKYPDGSTGGGNKTNGNFTTKPPNLSELGELTWDLTHRSFSKSTVAPQEKPTTTNPDVPQINGYTGKGDLVVTDLKVKGKWRKGDSITFEIDVKNQGSETITDDWLGASFFVNNIKTGWAGQKVSLAAKDSVTLTASAPWTATSSTVTVFVVIDDQNRIKELEEGNNYFSKTLD